MDETFTLCKYLIIHMFALEVIISSFVVFKSLSIAPIKLEIRIIVCYAQNSRKEIYINMYIITDVQIKYRSTKNEQNL